MATKLGTNNQSIKNSLIAQGCKVVERAWGHLVIMPNMGMALALFKEAIKNAGLEGYSDSIATHHMTPEYRQKYHKQFQYLDNPHLRDKLYWIVEDAIQQGDPRKIEAVSILSSKLVQLVYDICPSLKLDVERQRAENGDIWDAGLIASDDPRPCWDTKPSQRIKRGAAGDGAYRIVINTDTSFGRSDSENCLVLCAMIYVLQQYADVEIWVQQGWLPMHCNEYPPEAAVDGGNGMNGITLFPAFRGSGLHPAQVMFWCGHPMRDSIFSHLINHKIGRTSWGTSNAAELDCDLYTRNGCFGSMPAIDVLSPTDKQLKALAAWTAGQLSTVLLEESDLQNLTTE